MKAIMSTHVNPPPCMEQERAKVKKKDLGKEP